MEGNTTNQSSTVTLDIHLDVTLQQLEEAGVLNVILGIDTKLFIDPKLLDATDIPELDGASRLVRDYFDNLLRVNQQSAITARLVQIAIDMIAISEPKGLSIGYGNRRDSGTAIPLSVARASLRSLNEMLLVGINDIKVMEMLGLFVYKFGPDSISDLIAHIIYEPLCLFTQRVCSDLALDTTEYVINGTTYNLPRHPFKNHQIVFVPLNLLSPLPLATSWEEVSVAAQINASVRQSFNELVGTNIKNFSKRIKRDPRSLISSSTNMRMLIEVYSAANVTPYDIDDDAKGYYRLGNFASELKRSSTVASRQISDVNQMLDFIRSDVIASYRRHIEQLGQNSLLYQRIGRQRRTVDPTKPLHEDAAQIMFHTVADDACSRSNVMVGRESTTSAGAVDFTLGTGYRNKIVVEIKKSTNKDLIEGYEHQVGRYVDGEAAADAFYVVVIVRPTDRSNRDSKLNQLERLHAQNIREGQPCPHLEVINGLIRPTASVDH